MCSEIQGSVRFHVPHTYPVIFDLLAMRTLLKRPAESNCGQGHIPRGR